MRWDAKELFKIFPFYNTFIEPPKIKKLTKVQLLKEPPFYDELKMTKINNAFSGYAKTYKIETVDKRDGVIQLKASEISIKELFKNLLIELKGFRYQITLKVLKTKGDIEYSPVYFNSLTKIVINNDYGLDQSFYEIIYRLHNWISHGSGWIVEEILKQYLNISSYLALVYISSVWKYLC